MKLIAACAGERVLVESDYFDIDMCTSRTYEIVKVIAEIKEWVVEPNWVEYLGEKNWGVVHRLEKNWRRFRDGDHIPPSARKSAKNRRKTDQYVSPSPP